MGYTLSHIQKVGYHTQHSNKYVIILRVITKTPCHNLFITYSNPPLTVLQVQKSPLNDKTDDDSSANARNVTSFTSCCLQRHHNVASDKPCPFKISTKRDNDKN